MGLDQHGVPPGFAIRSRGSVFRMITPGPAVRDAGAVRTAASPAGFCRPPRTDNTESSPRRVVDVKQFIGSSANFGDKPGGSALVDPGWAADTAMCGSVALTTRRRVHMFDPWSPERFWPGAVMSI